MKFVISFILLLLTISSFASSKAIEIIHGQQARAYAQKLKYIILAKISLPDDFVTIRRQNHLIKSNRDLKSQHYISPMTLYIDDVGELHVLKFDREKWQKKYSVFKNE